MVDIKLLTLLGTAAYAMTAKRQSGDACTDYTLINTRGTGEVQGESTGFVNMNARMMQLMSGGSIYNTLYPAGIGLDSLIATADIVNHISTAMAVNPSMCFVLQGYSQGAIATISALSQLRGDQTANVRAIILLGNPEHKSGLECNIDEAGGSSTKDVDGVFAILGGIPGSWVTKSLDICAFGDGICDPLLSAGVTLPHLSYPFNTMVQDMGTQFMIEKLASTN